LKKDIAGGGNPFHPSHVEENGGDMFVTYLNAGLEAMLRRKSSAILKQVHEQYQQIILGAHF